MRALILIAFFASAVVTMFPTAFFEELERFNSDRRAFAKANAIPNMWRLDLDMNLIKQAEKFDCSNLKPGNNYRFFLWQGGQDEQKLKMFWVNWMNHTENANPAVVKAVIKEWEATSALFLEYMNYHQTLIGCAPVKCVVHYELPPIYVVYQRVCLFGPSNKLSITLPIDQHSGKVPGSDCGPDGSNFDGLCVRKNW